MQRPEFRKQDHPKVMWLSIGWVEAMLKKNLVIKSGQDKGMVTTMVRSRNTFKETWYVQAGEESAP